MFRGMIIVAALLVAGCSSPTSPDRAPVSLLRVAPGCSPTLPLPQVMDVPVKVTKDERTPDWSIGWWAIEVDGKPTLLLAAFQQAGALYNVCAWGTVAL